MPAPNRRPTPSVAALPWASVGVLLVLVLAGCSAASDQPSAEDAGSPASPVTSPAATASSAPEPSSTVSVPAAVPLTDQGSELSFGDPANVVFESTQKKGTVLEIMVRKVRRGILKDFDGFILDDPYKRDAGYYYATVRVRNAGEGDVGGVPVPLWGVNASNTLLPAVDFTTTFPACPTKPLPDAFGPGDVLDTCLVFLSPDKGDLQAVSYRPSREFDPVTWVGKIQPPRAAQGDKAKQDENKDQRGKPADPKKKKQQR